jgi:hypothetical protein
MNQAKPERTSVKLASATKTPKTIDIASDDFSAGQELFPLNAGGLCSRTCLPLFYTVSLAGSSSARPVGKAGFSTYLSDLRETGHQVKF